MAADDLSGFIDETPLPGVCRRRRTANGVPFGPSASARRRVGPHAHPCAVALGTGSPGSRMTYEQLMPPQPAAAPVFPEPVVVQPPPLAVVPEPVAPPPVAAPPSSSTTAADLKALQEQLEALKAQAAAMQ